MRATLSRSASSREKAVVDEVVRFDACDRERCCVVFAAREAVGARNQRRTCALVTVPCARRRQVDAGVRVGEPRVVALQQVAALALRQELGERAPRLGKDVAHAAHEPVDLRASREEDAAQHEAQHAVGMRFGIGDARASSPTSRRTAASARRCRCSRRRSRSATGAPSCCRRCLRSASSVPRRAGRTARSARTPDRSSADDAGGCRRRGRRG